MLCIPSGTSQLLSLLTQTAAPSADARAARAKTVGSIFSSEPNRSGTKIGPYIVLDLSDTLTKFQV